MQRASRGPISTLLATSLRSAQLFFWSHPSSNARKDALPMRPARARIPDIPETPDETTYFTGRQSAVARPIQRPLVVTPDGRLDKRSQRWLERQQVYSASAPPVAGLAEMDDSGTLVLPEVYENERLPFDTAARRAVAPY